MRKGYPCHSCVLLIYCPATDGRLGTGRDVRGWGPATCRGQACSKQETLGASRVACLSMCGCRFLNVPLSPSVGKEWLKKDHGKPRWRSRALIDVTAGPRAEPGGSRGFGGESKLHCVQSGPADGPGDQIQRVLRWHLRLMIWNNCDCYQNTMCLHTNLEVGLDGPRPEAL